MLARAAAGMRSRTAAIQIAEKRGGHARNRTGMQGFAVLCVTIPPRGLTKRPGLAVRRAGGGYSRPPAARTTAASSKGLARQKACVVGRGPAAYKPERRSPEACPCPNPPAST